MLCTPAGVPQISRWQSEDRAQRGQASPPDPTPPETKHNTEIARRQACRRAACHRHISASITHFVFSTKDRFPFIDPTWRADPHRYLGACLKTSGCVAQEIGGVADHVHIVAGLRATHRVADVMLDIKKASFRWVHREIGMAKFKWQEGYGAFTVSESNVRRVRKYVAGQELHHRKRSFQEEYLDLLTRHGIEFDERFLW
jgi:putative transposase